jgi:hypothetical protein
MNYEKHNISVPLREVDAFLGALDRKGIKPEESARIANELITALRKARENLDKGINDKNLTVCIGKAAYVDPKEMQKFLSREIPRITLYHSRKVNRHMGLYMKYNPQFYIKNQPKKKSGPRPIKKPKGN